MSFLYFSCILINDEFAKLFQDSIRLINVFVEETSYLFIGELEILDPSVEEMARTVKLFSMFLKEIASEPFYDENKATNIFQCSLIMSRMSDAVKAENLALYQELSKELTQHAK